ncbi:GNAT family N-acetyltransferase [Microbacterium sp. cf332]|uniref:GNAT family N-acetyltransferase n=1 Tax=Microbacterium sp. cf332 TaxID=1761804 RepID=UPI00088E885D|nr:N-acetyltransferase [Microbacterium sp. cf332]SDQ76123.1 Ribosomal protein S18 acetylase RimI [Microbacterium sp. cf332]
MEITIREPSAADAGPLAALHVETWRESYAHLLPAGFFTREFIEGRHRMWRHVLADARPDMTVRVADAGGDLVGFAWAGPTVTSGEAPPRRERQLYAIYVAAAHHGTGAGQSLLEAVLGAGPAELWVAKENPRAIAFYRRNGFEFDGIEQIDPTAPRITDARMVR